MHQIRSGNWFRLKIKPPSPHLYSFIPFHCLAWADSCASGCVSTGRSRGGRQQWQRARGGCCWPELVLSTSYWTVALCLRPGLPAEEGEMFLGTLISVQVQLVIPGTLGKCLKPIVWNFFELTLLQNVKLVGSRCRKQCWIKTEFSSLVFPNSLGVIKCLFLLKESLKHTQSRSPGS